jgi:methyl-accepting chemotaxis protein
VKIEGAISTTGQGVAITGKVAQALNEILTKARQMDDLAGEIAAASTEQAAGIGQINQAVVQVDKVTQSNAANAEETAASAEELNAQAETMKQLVMDLVSLVNGHREQVETLPSHHGPTHGPGEVSRALVPPLVRRHHPEALTSASHQKF